jgi:hypothetical protein
LPAARSDRQRLILTVLAVLVAPAAWWIVLGVWGPAEADQPPSYLPALEARRPRLPFDRSVIDDLRRLNPQYVLIGDSMARRISPTHLMSISGESVAPLYQNSTGPAYWYLTFKNHLIPSGVRPKWTFVFFRDTFLTDTLFRLTGRYRAKVDTAAMDDEPELNRIVAARTGGEWYAVHRAIDGAFAAERVREWLEPALTAWPASVVRGRDGAEALLDEVNDAFDLERLRPMNAADVEAASDAEMDFGENVESSVLPLLLSLAREHGLRLCFVRVIRRPENGRPPEDSPALRRYVEAFEAYVVERGAAFMDDRDDPRLARLPYSDGDHITDAARPAYTDMFWPKIRTLE